MRPRERVGRAGVGAPGEPRTPMIQRLGRAALRWSFDRLYHELAWAYDGVSWLVSGGRWRAWQRTVFDYLLPGELLEIGPGPGHLLVELLARGYRAWGLERSSSMLRRARARLAASGWGDRLLQGDALALPFADERFASIVLTFPAEFVFDPRFIEEASRVLRPEGRVVVVLSAEAGTWPWPGVLEWPLRWLRSTPGGGHGERRAACGAPDRPPDGASGAGLTWESREVRGPHGSVRLLLATKCT